MGCSGYGGPQVFGICKVAKRLVEQTFQTYHTCNVPGLLRNWTGVAFDRANTDSRPQRLHKTTDSEHVPTQNFLLGLYSYGVLPSACVNYTMSTNCCALMESEEIPTLEE
jgi:hypothetical protein